MARAKAEKPYHHGELREALVAAGRKLLEEKGLRSFTLRECARRAQVSHAAPAHHRADLALHDQRGVLVDSEPHQCGKFSDRDE